MITRAQQKKETAHAVLEAARAEFEQVGYEAATVRAIAARAGVSAGTVLNHFGDKRELLYAALYEDLERTLESALGRLGRGSLDRQLASLTRTVFRYYRERSTLSRALLEQSLFARGRWAQRFAGQTAAVHGRIAELAARAVERGELREDADPSLLAVAYLSFFYFGLISWVQGAHDEPEALVGALVEQQLKGLRP